MALSSETALVVFSGGQDSTTCLAWALERHQRVLTVGFDYGQRHAVELECRQRVLDALARLRPEWAARLAGDQVFSLGLFKEIGGTALTEEAEIRMGAAGLPSTFVPGRNLVFLTAAAAHAYRQGARHIVIGVCETDYSGYPDCRDDTVKALQVAINLGMQSRMVIHAPLMWIDKAATWAMAEELGGRPLVELILEQTHSCYLGQRDARHPWGYGCGTCPACQLRAGGWEAFQQRAGG